VLALLRDGLASDGPVLIDVAIERSFKPV
jgi:hypothetical protein